MTFGYIEIPKSLNIEGLVADCNPLFVQNCVSNQVLYRASALLTFFFIGMAICASYSDTLNRGWWGLKFLLVVGIFISFWWGSNSFFSSFAEVARVLSFFWLLVQGLLVLDVAHDIHDIVMLKAEAEQKRSAGSSSLWKLAYIVISVAFLIMGIVGLSYLLATPGYTDCSVGKGVVVFGLIVCITQLLCSMLNAVNRGVLTPCILFAYATFVVWYALLSNPNLTCNPSAALNGTEAKNAALGLVVALSMLILLFCVANGSRILQIFMVSGQGVLESGYGGYGTHSSSAGGGGADAGLEDGLTSPVKGDGTKSAEIGYTTDHDGEDDSSGGNASPTQAQAALADPNSTGSPRERMFFHVLMALASCYGGMVLTSWGRTTGEPEGFGESGASGNESMWLKLVSLWLFYLMYYKALHLAYLKQSGK